MIKKLLLSCSLFLAGIGMAFAAVNLNTASQQELEALNGIGPAKAKAIVEYRKANGGFKSVDDLKKVDGIGDKIFDKIKAEVAVSGASAAPVAAKAAASAAKSEAAAPVAKKDKAQASSSAASSAKKK